jgi:hypothetical protein
MSSSFPSSPTSADIINNNSVVFPPSGVVAGETSPPRNYNKTIWRSRQSSVAAATPISHSLGPAKRELDVKMLLERLKSLEEKANKIDFLEEKINCLEYEMYQKK